MSYDLFAELENGLNIPQTAKDVFKRQKETVNVYTAHSDEQKNDAKGRAKGLTKNWVANKDLENYLQPSDFPPLLKRTVSVKMNWKMKTPFFSRSNSEFSAIDNPIERDTLTGKPVLHASGIKGLLRAVMIEKDKNVTIQLFGNDRLDDDNISVGRMVIGDIMFDKADTDMFAPHEREFGVVDHPVTFEIVPAKANAEWGFTIIEYSKNEIDLKKALSLLLESLSDLLIDFGISAKRSSGYGLCEKIKLEIKIGSDLNLNSDALEKKEFSTPAPPKPTVSNSFPTWNEALVKDGKMTCSRTEAVQKLIAYQCKKENKTGKQVKKIEKQWSKKDKAGKLFDECEKIINSQQGEAADELKEANKIYNKWLKEKKEWDNGGWKEGNSIEYKYNSIDDAISAIETMEVKKC